MPSMIFGRFSFCRCSAVAAFLGGVVPVVAAAQARGVAGARVRILIVAVDSAQWALADTIATATVGHLSRLVAPDQLLALSWRDVLRVPSIGEPEPPTPKSIDRADLLEIGRGFAAEVLEIRIASKPGAMIEIRPLLMLHRTPVIPWATLSATGVSQVAELLARRIATDSTLHRLGIAALRCPTDVFYEFQVQRPARFIHDSTSTLRPARPGERGASFIEVVVDTTGRPELATLKALNLPQPTLLPSIRAAAGSWRFRPAQRGSCPSGNSSRSHSTNKPRGST